MANKRSASDSGSNSEGGGGGGSRAAKKRAKKKEKLQQNKATVEFDGDDIIDQEDQLDLKKKTKDDKRNKKVKLQLPLGEENENDEEKRPSAEKVKDDDPVETVDHVDQSDADDEEDEWENNILEENFSHLTPAEILFPENISFEINDNDEQDMGPADVLNSITTDKRANLLFNSILSPSGLSRDAFYKHYWEKKPLLISTSSNTAEPDREGTIYGDELDLDKEAKKIYEHRFDGFLSKKRIEQMISDYSMKYVIDLNVTNYCSTGSAEKHRITLDQLPDTNENDDDYEIEYISAESNDVWSNFKSGCTIRLLCPQKHNDEVHSLLSNLEYEFGCMVGSNAYLTPGGAPNQGFAPHYDDIEAFILQLEGYKHWRVYPPMSKEETLPRESSRDFTEAEMKDIEPIIDVVLGPGDLLYMPRGWIHQANTCKSNHDSLHLTISAMQKWSWVDLLENIMPQALEAASKKSLSLRSGLPRNFLSYMGTMHDNDESGSEILKQLQEKMNNEEENNTQDKNQIRIKKLQDEFKAETKKKIMRVCKEALSMITDGCDQIGVRYLIDRLPPSLTPNESAFTSENRAETGGKIFPNTLVRLAKPGLARLVVEGDKAVVYHSLDNSRVYHEVPLSPLEFEIDDAPALEMLLTTIEPHWICVQDLIHGDIEDKMDIAQSLYDEGILAMFQNDAPDKTVQTG